MPDSKPLPWQSWNVFNPFATRFTRPGEIPFLPPPELDLAEIGARFDQANWIGQIVGPHGVGKTTLALAFRERQSRFSKSRHLIFRSGSRFWQPDSFQIEAACGSAQEWTGKSLDAYWRGQVLVIVDGWENLSRLNRYLLRRHCRRTASGLIVTSHQPIRSLPVLARLVPSLDVFRDIVRHLLQRSPIELDDDEIQWAYEQTRGDYREALMLLYDRFARQQQNLSGPVNRSSTPD